MTLENFTKFEIWYEQLLKVRGYHGVRRNVIYYKKDKVCRQIDSEYFRILSPFEGFVIGELKYTSNGYVGLVHRRLKREKNGQKLRINDIVDEVEEKRRFVKADKAYLVTNGYFGKKVIEKAKKHDVQLYDLDFLTELYNRRLIFNRNLDVNEAIKKIKSKGHREKAHIVRM